MPAVVSAQPSGYQEYYVLGYEEHIWRAYLAIYEGPDRDIPGRICSTVSLVATADHQTIYFDHWEDGYEADLLNPVQPTTEVYGDGNLSNGGAGSDILLAGDDVNLTSDQDLTGGEEITGCVPVDPARNPLDVRYDGGDRVVSSGGPIDLTHAMWPLNNSWIGGAWEVYSRQAFAEAFSYRMPIGEDLYVFGGGDNGTYGDFRNVFLQVGAFEDNTVISIDNGADVVNLTLDRGSTYFSMGFINSSPAPRITVNSGTTIRSNKPTQVGMVTGADSRGGDGFQGRFFIVLSDHMWGADYVVPVPSGGPDDPAEIYLANPNDFPITINAYDAEIQTSFVISPSPQISSTVPYSEKREGLGYVPQDSAVRLTSSDGVFGVVVAVDSSDITYDWGFSAIPAKYLTRDYYVSWAPGTTDLSDNGSPVWVTPLSDGTTFYVDFSPLDGITDETFTLDVLQQRRVFDPDNDNTGTHIWATTEFAVAWGEDPRRSGPSSPYLDLGVSTLPLLQRWLDPVLTLDKTASPTILPSAGGIVTFTLVAQGYDSPLVNVDVTDTLPLHWSYVPNSTRVTYPNGISRMSEPTRDGPNLFWDLSTGLDINQALTLTFQAQITRTGGVERTAHDGFESDTYRGGANWAGDWREQGDNGDPNGGHIRIVTSDSPFIGNHHLQIRAANNSISRAVDLTGFLRPTLHFVRRVDELERGDFFFLDIQNGSSWTTVLAWTDGDLEGSYVHEIVDLIPYVGTISALRFRSGSSVGALDYLHVDQIEVYESIGVSVNRGEAVGKDEYSNTLFSPSDEATVYISPFSLIKSVSKTHASIGETLAYTLSYANLSTYVAATNVTLRDAVPVESVTFQSASNGGVYDAASSSVFWELGTLAPGASGYVTFTARVNSFVEDGAILRNVAYLKSDQNQAGSNEVRTTVMAPRIKFSKMGPDGAALGQVMTYTLSYENVGSSEATGVVLSDVVPAFTTYLVNSLAINTGNGWVFLSDAADGDQGAYISPTLTVDPGVRRGRIASGESGQIRFSVRIDKAPPPSLLILNSATLDRDLDFPRESNTVATYLSDLLLEKAAEQTVVAPSDVISYAISYENISKMSSQTNAYVLEQIPGFTSFIPNTAYGGDRIEYSWDNGATWTTTIPTSPVTHLRWYDAEVPINGRASVGFAVQVNPILPPNTFIQNTARIRSDQTAMRLDGWIPSNEVRVGTVDLWVQKHVSQSAARPGEPISYTVFYGNHGSVDARGVRIQDTLPFSTAYQMGSIWGTGADDSGNPMLAWHVMEVPAGASAGAVGYSVVLASDLSPGAVITNVATLTSPYGFQISDPVIALVTVPISPIISLEKRASTGTVAPSEQFTYTLKVVNNGPTVHGVIVTDAVPNGTSFVSCGNTSCRIVGDTVFWGPVDLAGEGTTLDLTLVVAVHAGLPNGWPIVNAGYGLIAEDARPVWGLPVTTTVSVAELGIVKWAFSDHVFDGSRLDYGILVRNAGGRASHLVVSDTLPLHTTFGGCDCAVAGLAQAVESPLQERSSCGVRYVCGVEGNAVVWRAEELSSGRSLQMTFWVTVDAKLAENSLIVNDSYIVTADHVSPVIGGPPVTTTVRRLDVLISKAAWPDPVTVTHPLIFTITVQNEGSPLQDLTVTDLLPGGVSFVSCQGALCDYSNDAQRRVRWWLPSLPASSERKLTVRVRPIDLKSDKLVNESYSVWIPAARRRVAGMPVSVKLINPFTHQIYLPVLLASHAP